MPENADKLFYVIDFDLHPIDKNDNRLFIEYYKNGRMVDKDFYESQKNFIGKNMAKSPFYDNTFKKPQETILLSIPCPGRHSHECPNDDLYWLCDKCKDNLEYGFDKRLYCKCGSGLAETYVFKCSDSIHPS